VLDCALLWPGGVTGVAAGTAEAPLGAPEALLASRTAAAGARVMPFAQAVAEVLVDFTGAAVGRIAASAAAGVAAGVVAAVDARVTACVAVGSAAACGALCSAREAASGSPSGGCFDGAKVERVSCGFKSALAPPTTFAAAGGPVAI